jgi:hypothetical protein
VAKRAPAELKNTGYEIFIGMLSVLSIVNLVIMYFFLDDGALQGILRIMNSLLSGIFLIDFIYRFSTASSRRAYFLQQYGWADLLASIPLPQFKVLRVFRLFRVYRLLREFGMKNIARGLLKDRAGSALLMLLLAGILVLEFGSLAVLRIEQSASGGNIKTASDALWYVIVTISTVGYGDRFPITDAGRLIGALIIVVGVGIFGTFTGYLANLFLSPPKADADADAATPGLTEIEQLKALMAEQQAKVEGIECLLRDQAAQAGGDTRPTGKAAPEVE